MTWENKPLLQCVDLLQGLTYSPSNVKQHGLLVLRSSNVKNGKLAFEDCVFVDCAIDENKYVQPNDILVCVRNGSSALIGKSCVINQAYNATFGAFMSVLRGDKTGYIAHIFVSDIVQSQIRNRSSATINQITKRDFEDIVIPIPADEFEQRRIAEALSDMDALLAAMEKLIAKKRAIKHGVMQELLTGKQRLLGFEGEWIVGVWKDVLAGFSSGATPYRGKPEYYKGSIKWITSGELNYNVLHDSIEHISETACIDTSLTLHPPGVFLMAITGLEAAGTRGSCAILGAAATTNQSCMAIYGTTKMSTKYLFHYYAQFGERLAFEYCQGTKQQSYTAKIVKELPIAYPSDVAEQTAIAEILSDMDAEIDALTVKLNKLRNIKQGMMSELLTGRIRLTEQQAEAVPAQKGGHNQQFDDAVMIAGIVNVLYSGTYPLGRKKVQKCLYLLRRHQNESTAAFKKKAAGPYADEVRYKGGEPIAQSAKYITRTDTRGKGTTFARGEKISQALDYIQSWGKQADIKWVADKLKFKKVDELELLATVDMAICDLTEAEIPVSVASIKHLIATNEEWKAKLKKQTFTDTNINYAIQELRTLLSGGIAL